MVLRDADDPDRHRAGGEVVPLAPPPPCSVDGSLSGAEHFHSLADQLPLIVWQHDVASSQDWVNETFCRFFGVTRDAMRGDRWQALLHPDDAPAYNEAFAAAVAERRSFHAEVRVRRADGEWRWMESWGQPRLAADGDYLGHVGTSADVTDRKAAELALRAAAAIDAYRARLADALRSAAEPVEVQARAAELLGEELGASRVHYAEVEESGEYGIVSADYHPSCSSVVGRHRFDDHGPAVMNVFRAGRTVVVDDVTTDPRLRPEQRAATAALEIGAYVMVPLFKWNRAVAVLVVHHTGPHAWTGGEIALVEETAERTWAAVERARVDEGLRVRHARAELVADLLSDLEQQPDLVAQAQCLAEALVPVVADYATVEAPGRDERVLGIAHRDPDLLETLRALRVHHPVPEDDANSVARAAAGATQLISEVTSSVRARYETDPTVAELLGRLAPLSHMAVPLDLGGGVRGALMAGITDPRRPHYTRDDLAFFTDTAQRVGVVLTAARLRQEEHDISVRLQQALLPDHLLWHPNVVVEARYQAASALLDVGGDWYDTFAWPNGRIGVMVGDVVGHNLDSAATMGRLRAATAALAAHIAPSPAALMAALEQFARGRDGTDFATAVCVVVDPATGRLTYSSAGHPPVVVVAPDGTSTRLTGAQTPPLGAEPVGARPEAAIDLAPGSLVVMYSDGLVERRRERLDRGLDRLEAVASRLRHEPIRTVADRLVAELTAGSPPEDDIVVACFRYTPVVERIHRRITATSTQLAGLRSDLRGWLDELAMANRLKGDVLLGVGEACTNAIEHAYQGVARGSIDVELTHHRDHVTACVTDHGSWRPAGQHSRFGGRGTTIMQTLAENYSRTTGPDGTRVLMTFPVHAGVEAATP
jgi:PAS domain S-box-containing protein